MIKADLCRTQQLRALNAETRVADVEIAPGYTNYEKAVREALALSLLEHLAARRF